MPRTISIRALGAVICIDGSALSDEAWASAKTAWQDALIDPRVKAAPDATVAAHGTVSAAAMLSALSMDVTFAALEARAGQLLMLHAAGLATADGGVVVLAGPSGRGKTTASRVLGRRFGYVSDESVGIAADGIVLPYRKPLSLIESDHPLKTQRSPTELGLLTLPESSLRVAALVLLERSDDADEPRLQLVSAAEGIAGLAQQASYLGRLPTPLRTITSHIQAVGGVHRITYRDSESLAPLIRELGARRRVSPRRVVAPAKPGSPTFTAPRRDATPRYRRVPVIDSLVLDDQQLVVLVQDEESTRIVILDGIAPTLWQNAAVPTSLAALVEAAVAAHGDPIGADAVALVTASLADLTEAGLLVSV